MKILLQKEQKLLLNTIFWGLLTSRGVFAFLLFDNSSVENIENSTNPILPIFTTVLFFFTLISIFAHKKSYDGKFLLKNSVLEFYSNNFLRISLAQKNWTEDKLNLWIYFTKYQVVSVIAWAFSEAIAIMTLVMSISGVITINQSIIFIFLSIILGLYQRPNFKRFQQEWELANKN